MFTRVFRQVTSAAVIFTLLAPLMVPFKPVYAQDLAPIDAATMEGFLQEGHGLFNNFLSDGNAVEFDPTTNSLTIPLVDDNGVSHAETYAPNELSGPDAGGGTTASDSYGNNQQMLQDGYGSRAQLHAQGQGNVNDDVDRDSFSGDAYYLMREGHNRNTINLTNDPIADGVNYLTSDQGRQDWDTTYGVGCEANDDQTINQYTNIPQLSQCVRQTAPTQTCDFEHIVDFNRPIIDLILIADRSVIDPAPPPVDPNALPACPEPQEPDPTCIDYPPLGDGFGWRDPPGEACTLYVPPPTDPNDPNACDPEATAAAEGNIALEPEWEDLLVEQFYATARNILTEMMDSDSFDLAVGGAILGHPDQEPPAFLPTKNLTDFEVFEVTTSGGSLAYVYESWLYQTLEWFDDHYTPRPGAETVYIFLKNLNDLDTSTFIVPTLTSPPPTYINFPADPTRWPYFNRTFTSVSANIGSRNFYVSMEGDSATLPFPVSGQLTTPLIGDSLFSTLTEFIEIQSDVWVDSGACMHEVTTATQNNCTVTPISMFPIDDPLCAILDNHYICNIDDIYQEIAVPPWNAPGLNRLVTGGSLSYTCDAVESGNCAVMEQNCSFVSSEPQGVVDAIGNYSSHLETWNCGAQVYDPATFNNAAGFSNCGSAPQIACIDGNCGDYTKESSDQFAEVAALSNAADMATYDSHCDITKPDLCTAFDGSEHKCRDVFFGAVNCCDTPSNVTLTQYMAGIQAMKSIDGYYGGNIARSVTGAWTHVTRAGTNMWAAIRPPVASAAEAASGHAIGDMTPAILDAFKQRLLESSYAVIEQLFGPQVAGAVFSTGVNAAGENIVLGLNPTLLAGLNFLATAYMVYQVSLLILNLVFACDDDDYSLGNKKELQSCVHVDTRCHSVFGCSFSEREAWCCFNSPLSLLVQTEARAQLGRPYGEYNDLDCEGLTFAELAQVDWSQVDWDVWEDVLVDVDLIPDAADITIDSLTGPDSRLAEGHDIDNGVVRLNSADRTELRMTVVDAEQVADEARPVAHSDAISSQ